ncbi:MAG: hypothetical protein HZA46_15030 [Planctomycetales bacterium]|nr:hypothetical protein [Planctomycetales bacterium]
MRCWVPVVSFVVAVGLSLLFNSHVAAQDSTQRELDKAQEEYKAALDKAIVNLLNTFDKEMESLRKSKMVKAEDKLKWLEILEVERKSFESEQRIPWSVPMRPATGAYLQALIAAQGKLSKAYDKPLDRATRKKEEARAKELVEMKNRAAEIKVLATWNFVGTNFESRFSRNLFSNGKLDDLNGKSTWTIEKDKLVLRIFRGDGKSFVDTCTLAADGQSLTGGNQFGGRFNAEVVRSSK